MSDYYAPGSVRRPLRPLPEILRARGQGENPDLIERANKDSRHAVMADRQRRMSEGRLIVMALFFVLLFGTVGVRMGQLATAEPVEPHASSPGPSITSARADIVDREGRLLATNLRTRALYAHPHQMVDRELAIEKLLEIFPDLDREDLAKKFAKGRKFAWIRRTLSPEEAQKVHEIGEPGLLFASRDLRLYPNGPLGAHILGGAGYGHEGVGAAEVIGIAGVERHQNDR
ncbi:MAG: penicillin-binding protein 2, partial [Mangrovicoccus sp.]